MASLVFAVVHKAIKSQKEKSKQSQVDYYDNSQYSYPNQPQTNISYNSVPQQTQQRVGGCCHRRRRGGCCGGRRRGRGRHFIQDEVVGEYVQQPQQYQQYQHQPYNNYHYDAGAAGPAVGGTRATHAPEAGAPPPPAYEEVVVPQKS